MNEIERPDEYGNKLSKIIALFEAITLILLNLFFIGFSYQQSLKIEELKEENEKLNTFIGHFVENSDDYKKEYYEKILENMLNEKYGNR